MDHVSPEYQYDADDRAGRAVLNGSRLRPFLLALALFAAAGFTALGVWQIERRTWKLDLIARVEARIHAQPAPLTSAQWHGVTADDEYRRVYATGIYRHDRETLVQALTERGAGFWVLTPLVTPNGTVVINRGFVPDDRRDPATRAAVPIGAPVAVTGLLRLSEPGGTMLRANAPDADRWYSRDVAAIARARGLGAVAPFFIDTDAAPNPGGYPVGGLTVVRFRNTHLIYALTWFALAALSVAAVILLLRKPGRR